MSGKPITRVLGIIFFVWLGGRFSSAQTDTETILHTFVGKDGGVPEGIFFDKAGHMYGTTQMGGSGPCTFPGEGCGEVFEATPFRSPSGSVTWKKRVIYEFQGGTSDGESPLAPLVMDSAGNLYGTTAWGGTGCGEGCGTVFQLRREGGEGVGASRLCSTGSPAAATAGLPKVR